MPTQTTIDTAHRRITSAIPHPDSLADIAELEQIEPRAMAGFPPIMWDHAEGASVFDAYGNQWIDFTSSVVLTNAGHSHPRIADAIRTQLEQNMWHCYCNPSKIRRDAVEAIKSILPPYLDKVFLLTTGSESVECALKLTRIHGRRIDPQKYHIVSYFDSFHGRTMGSQAAGGFPAAQQWMGARPPGFHNIAFPGPDDGADFFHRSMDGLAEAGVNLDHIAGFITETFQGPHVRWLPDDYIAALRRWCDDHQALLIFDEMQAGFGRTGKWSGFEHHANVEIDLACYGKGITSSLPLSAVAGRAAIMDLPDHGDMSSTHTGNPLCAAAAVANIQAIREDRLVENAAALGPVAREALHAMRDRFPDRVGAINGRGLVFAVHFANHDVPLGQHVTTRCMETGLLMLQTNKAMLKIAPPLCITEDALREGIGVIAEAIDWCIEEKK